ncbi:MmgE/PrpD family protein [Mesorhizobium sp.]|uniref:MmgE/PrpD family protein n=1 Tax=Mesorhizobium sp. TaxID=1871066 RepID=UPI000FE80293|nr:MmgE/PrpD family protein [Mesorhizobium sp.]RWD50836.1 MAG: MmgE/PrpD family protein [Mesorhizobium sp.]RWD96775.1 MAG: MmgE/PrpD family protein [Mesorhizobium sp.]
MHAISELADFISSFSTGKLAAETREAITLLILDLLGAAGAGFNSTLATSARTSALEAYGEGNVSIWFTGERSSVVGAAMANSAAASALDIDDGHRGAGGHPGAGIIPAALAVAQAVGAADLEIMMAIALGYEVGLRVASCRPVETVEMYASGRWVNFGVAAAVARLLGLGAEKTAHALAIAGCEGPVVYFSKISKFDGSSIKEGIPPAVVAGITAAYRARAGAKGPLDILDDDSRFTRKYLTGNIGSSWEVQKCYLKPYACCRYMHAAIDAILAMRKVDKPIRSLRIETFPLAMRLANERAPTTLEGGQYSFYFSCALAALHGRVALQPVEEERLRDQAVLELASRIELDTSPHFSSSFPITTPARAIIDQGDGSEEMTVLHAFGDVANPLSPEQITEKFKNVVRYTVATQWQDEIVTAIRSLHTAGFDPLFAVLTSPGSRQTAPTVCVSC